MASGRVWDKMTIRWFDWEIDILVDSYESLSKEEIISHLKNRTWTSITQKAKRLGLHRMEKIKLNLSDIEKGYIAGLIDGEGSITFKNHGKFVGSPHIIITNTNKEVIEWLIKKIPHTKLDCRKETIYWKKTYHAKITHRETISALLKDLEHILIIKQQQAKIILNYLENHRKYGRKIRNNSGEFIRGVEEPIYAISLKQIRELNRRGNNGTCSLSMVRI